MDFQKVMDNMDNIYYGHGTGIDSKEIIDSIMHNGLRCSHGALYFTSVTLCQGKKVTDEVIKLLKNWPHKSSNIIFIVSLPAKYNIVDSTSLGTYNCANAAYYYIPSVAQRQKYSLTNSNYVMPEFIKGYYDAALDKFVQNSRYYELLPKDEQEKLFEKVKYNYINIINDTCGMAEYKKLFHNFSENDFPLTEDDIEKAKKVNCSIIINSLTSIAEKKNIFFNGRKMNLEQYIWQFVYPYLPQDGVIIMKDNTVHTIIDFIENYILKDCINYYNGDAQKYLWDNTKNNLGITSITRPSLFEEMNIDYVLVEDVINYIDHNLLEKTISLSDGTKMSIKDFIINIYAPYIPHSGQMMLKDGTIVTIKAFIEEYMFKNDEIVYDGDIQKIMMNLTCNNNGFVVCEKNKLIENLESLKLSLENYHQSKNDDDIDEFIEDGDFDKGW